MPYGRTGNVLEVDLSRGLNDGIPTKETLEKLGLDYVSQDLQQRGILTD